MTGSKTGQSYFKNVMFYLGYFEMSKIEYYSVGLKSIFNIMSYITANSFSVLGSLGGCNGGHNTG